MIDWVNRPQLQQLKEVRARLGEVTPLQWLLALGAVAGVASLVIYDRSGYSRAMLLIWFVALAALSIYFGSRSRTMPRIARADLLLGAGLVVVFAPLYVLKLYSWPVQVNGDEVAIPNFTESQLHPVPNVDPFGISTYFSRPELLFLAWAKLGNWIGGFDLYHMRLLHALFGLLTIAASYALLRQLLPRWWAVFAACVFGSSHSFFMISRLAMRENTSVLLEVVALALLLWGLRNEHALVTFWGGVLAGLGFYVYYPARATLPVWIVFLVLLALVSRRTFPVRRILLFGSIALAGFVLMATPIMISESRIPHTPGPSEADPTRQTLMIFKAARLKEQEWVSAPTVAEGVKKNIRWGLGVFNNEVIDNGYIYVNTGHGFADPLTGILLWIGIGLLLVRLIRRRADEGVLLAVTGFLALWLSFAFLVNKAPNYTRLLVTLPFVAYLVTEAVRWLAGRWRSVRYAPAAVVAVSLTALVAWNLAIAWDFIQAGRRNGDTVGSTGRYVSAHRNVPGVKFFIASSVPGGYYSYGDASAYEDRLKIFAADDSQVQAVVDPNLLGQFNGQPPFALFMTRDLMAANEAKLAKRYPLGRFRNLMPDGLHVVLEVPAQVR
jgi:Dolichyl-phosphate-mannose-protein mannosyltransferase